MSVQDGPAEAPLEETGEPKETGTKGLGSFCVCLSHVSGKTPQEIAQDIAARKKMQKKIRGQLKRDNRRKQSTKNDYKNREKRALHREAEESKHDY